MPAAKGKKSTKAVAAAAEVTPEPAPAPVIEEAPAPAPVPAPVEAAAKTKKAKKAPKIVAVVTPDGIEGSFLPEPRRPLIAHLQINTAEIRFHENAIFYDPNPPTQVEPYDAGADNFFGQQNEQLTAEQIASQAANAAMNDTVNKNDNTSSSNTKQTVAAPLEAFTKCDLMLEYKELKGTKKIPDTTSIACFWCAHPFTWKPCVIPEREEKGTYRVYGNFCSPNCCMASLLQESLDTHVRWERIALLHRLYGKNFTNGRIFPSPARESLKLFGGPMDIEQYRATISHGRVRIDMQVPPMVSILGSIDTKPIDFYDSSMKHTISPLLGEMVPKAEEGLRLKRSKPLKEKGSTLDSVLKIQIKGKA